MCVSLSVSEVKLIACEPAPARRHRCVTRRHKSVLLPHMIRRVGIVARFVFALGGLIVAQRVHAAPEPPETEEWVEGVRFLARADSLEALRAMVKADFAWTDADGVAVFLWIKPDADRKHWRFTLDAAHRVNDHDKIFWCFLDESSDDGKTFGDPVTQFFVRKFVRAQLEYPGPDNDHDGNNSCVHLISENKTGGRVFELTYCSEGGPRANQEQVKTYLLYVAPDGRCFRATDDLGHQGGYPHGWLGALDEFKDRITWKTDRAWPPFEIAIRRDYSNYVASADDDDHSHDYTTSRDAIMSEAFPMAVKWDAADYVESDGKVTLAWLARAMAFYDSGWAEADWVPVADRPRVKNEIAAMWVQELVRLNPGVRPDEVLAAGKRLRPANEGEFSWKVFERIRREVKGER
jgi:hypothetical protein